MNNKTLKVGTYVKPNSKYRPIGNDCVYGLITKPTWDGFIFKIIYSESSLFKANDIHNFHYSELLPLTDKEIYHLNKLMVFK